ncbi:unnamed protein product [Colias eurytheme]|nr:unnamed protein product [Colias eurytheme]
MASNDTHETIQKRLLSEPRGERSYTRPVVVDGASGEVHIAATCSLLVCVLRFLFDACIAVLLPPIWTWSNPSSSTH